MISPYTYEKRLYISRTLSSSPQLQFDMGMSCWIDCLRWGPTHRWQRLLIFCWSESNFQVLLFLQGWDPPKEESNRNQTEQHKDLGCPWFLSVSSTSKGGGTGSSNQLSAKKTQSNGEAHGDCVWSDPRGQASNSLVGSLYICRFLFLNSWVLLLLLLPISFDFSLTVHLPVSYCF